MFRNYKYDPKDPSDKHSFEIHNLDLAFVNGFRRVILAEIPIPGIIGEDHPTVDILVNTGPLHNEILSHRIGLIPICLNENDIESYEDNSITLELNITNTDTKMLNVSSGNIIVKKNDKVLNAKETENIFPYNNVSKSHILITRLRTNEQLYFTASVVKKTAKFNASFSPVSLCNHYFIQDKTIADKKDNILDKERSFYTNKYGDPNAFMFEIEPIHHLLTPKYLINKSIDIIITKLNNLRDNINNNLIKNEKFNNLHNTVEFSIDDEDDTLGNIIQSFIHNKFIREKNTILNNISCSYIGYICPHPLKSLLLIRITLPDITDISTFIQFLDYNCKNISDYLNDIKVEWNNFIINNK